MVCSARPITVRELKAGSVVKARRISPEPLKFVDEACKIYPSEVALEGDTGRASHDNVADVKLIEFKEIF